MLVQYQTMLPLQKMYNEVSGTSETSINERNRCGYFVFSRGSSQCLQQSWIYLLNLLSTYFRFQLFETGHHAVYYKSNYRCCAAGI